jgi:hypothetical protein
MIITKCPECGKNIISDNSTYCGRCNTFIYIQQLSTTEKEEAPMICQNCGKAAKTYQFQFSQNIGMIVERKEKHIKGYFCRRCASEFFLQYTGITLILGWWGIISFFVAGAFIIINIIYYLNILRIITSKPGDEKNITFEYINMKLSPFKQEILERMKKGEENNVIAQDMARKSGLQQKLVLLQLRYWTRIYFN